MNRSLLQPSPSKRSIAQENNNPHSGQKPIRNNMSNYTQIIIQTNDHDVPFVSIFKPNIKRQQRRIQAIVCLQKNFKIAEISRVSFAFSKMSLMKYQQQHYFSKIAKLKLSLQKLVKKRLNRSLLQLTFNKIKKNNIIVALKWLNFFHNAHRLKNSKQALVFLKINYYSKVISSISNESSVSKQLQQTKRQLFQQRQGNYSKQIIATCKTYIKIGDFQTLLVNIQEKGIQQSIRQQIVRFEKLRQQSVPKRKQQFDNEILLNVMHNIQQALQYNIQRRSQREQQLNEIILGYTNKEGIQQLTQIISQKQSMFTQLSNFLNQINRLDSQLKRSQNQPSQKLLIIFTNQQKRIKSKGLPQNILIQKLLNSRLCVYSFIAHMVKRYSDQRQSLGQQINDFLQNITEQNALVNFIRKIKDNSSLKKIGQFILSLHKTINNNKSSNQALANTNEILKTKYQQLLNKYESQGLGITELAKLVEQGETRMNNEHYFGQKQFNNYFSNIALQQILQSLINIINSYINLAIENKNHLKQIEEITKKRSIPYSQTKPIKSPLTPNKNKLQQRQLELSLLAQHFLSPLKEAVEKRKDDSQLKYILIECKQKIQEIIRHNHFLEEKLKLLASNDKIIQELTLKNTQLFEKLRQCEKQKLQISSQANSYQLKIRQLSFVNGQLTQQIDSLKQSFNQFNTIANSNIDLGHKINEIYERSKVESRQQQQLMKQTELMKEIINHKLQSQNSTIKHFKEVQSLKAQINSYKTIISKLQADIVHKEEQNTHLQSTIKSISTRYQEIIEINKQFKVKMDHFERQRNDSLSNKFREGEAQLIRLKKQCNNIYLELERQAENINTKNYQLQSYQARIRQQQKTIFDLKQEKQSLSVQFQELLVQYSTTEQQLSKSKFEINQLKSQNHTIQLQILKNQSNYTHISTNYQHLQSQLNEKQATINNLIEQAKISNSSFASQLLQSRQEYSNLQKLLQQKISQKDMKLSRLQFQLNQKLNTITSLQQIISLYASTQEQHKKQKESTKNHQSRDRQIQYLYEQIKSLQEFVSQITIQYHELQLRYQQQRQRTNRSFTTFTPQKHSDIAHYRRRQHLSSQGQTNYKIQRSEVNSHIYQNQNDISLQLDKLLTTNQNLSYSFDFLRQENKQLFMKVKNISSTELMIELLYNILLNVSKLKSDELQAAKLWDDLCHIRTQSSGQNLFSNLQSYCSTFIQKYRK